MSSTKEGQSNMTLTVSLRIEAIISKQLEQFKRMATVDIVHDEEALRALATYEGD